MHRRQAFENTRAVPRLQVLAFVALLAMTGEGCKAPQPGPSSRELPSSSLLQQAAVHKQTSDELKLQRFQFAHPAMGTLFSITLFAPDKDAAESAADAAFKRVLALEDIMSDYQADSELMQLCDQPMGKPVRVSPDLFSVLERSQQLSRLSGGAFDATMGPYVRLWRFARKRKVLPLPVELARAKSATGWKNLRLDKQQRTVTLLAPNMRLDLGGIAKGYAADAALNVLKEHGMDRSLVAASGDLSIGNPPPGESGWKVGISQMGSKSNQLTGTVRLSNAGISTSGDTEQFIEIGGVRYSHILDPATGLGLTNRIQATTIAPNATWSDPLATTMCILGPARGLRLIRSLPNTAALIIVEKNGAKRSYQAGNIHFVNPEHNAAR